MFPRRSTKTRSMAFKLPCSSMVRRFHSGKGLSVLTPFSRYRCSPLYSMPYVAYLVLSILSRAFLLGFHGSVQVGIPIKKVAALLHLSSIRLWHDRHCRRRLGECLLLHLIIHCTPEDRTSGPLLTSPTQFSCWDSSHFKSRPGWRMDSWCVPILLPDKLKRDLQMTQSSIAATLCIP